jgi:transcriptional regulator with XRE-family HTH domain
MKPEKAEPDSVEAFYGAAIFVLRRQFRRWGQRKLAKETGIAHSSISHYEHGKTVPSLEVRKKIASALGVPLARLHRLAVAIQGGMAGISQNSQGYEALAGEIAFELADDFRRGSLPLILKLLAATLGRDAAGSPPAPPALARCGTALRGERLTRGRGERTSRPRTANPFTRPVSGVARLAMQLLLPGLREPVKRFTSPVAGCGCTAPRLHALR